MENIKEQLEAIRIKLARLKELDSSYSGFGSESHKNILNKRLTQSDIEQYQTKYNIILPEEYAQFLMHIGNGGAGPCYGLLPLEENENSINISEVFPYQFESPLYLEGKYDEFYERMDECESLDEEDAVCEELNEIKDREYLDSLKGFIDLNHEGCAMYNILIVNGKDHGCVWFFDFSDDFGTVPLINPESSKPMRFLDWYELWLDEQIEFFENKTKGKTGFGSYISYAKPK